MTPPAASVAPIPATRPRRVSGGPRGAQAFARGAVAAPGISRPRVRTQPRRASVKTRPQPRAGESLLGRLTRVADHRLLDRLIRGRLWIGVLTFALIGIVAMQLAILSFNRATGQALERVTQLQRENPALSIANSTATAGENVEPQAAARGMAMASLGAIQFLPAGSGDLSRAVRILSSSTAPAASQAPSQSSEGASVQTSSPAGESEGSQTASVPQASSQSPATSRESTGEQSPSAGGPATEAGSQSQTSTQPVSPTSSTTTSEGGGYPPAQAPTVGSQGGTQAGP